MNPSAFSDLGARARALGRLIAACARRGTFDPLPAPIALGSCDTIPCSPALYDHRQIDRVIGCGFGVRLKDELAKLDATSFTETPLARYDLGESIILGGQILTGSARRHMSKRSIWRALGCPPRQIDAANLINSEQGLAYFGHWLRDDCAVYECLPQTPLKVSMRRPDWPDCQVYERGFDQTWDEVDFARVDRLTIYRDLGFSRDKARRLQRLRAKLRTHFPDAKGKGRIVYISRGSSGSERNMSNARDFEAALVKGGVDIIEPEADAEALLSALLDVRLIITIEGSQASHGVYSLADGGSLLILQPPDRFYNPHHEWARLLGMRSGLVVGERDGTSFRVNPAEVFQMMERLLSDAPSAG